MDRHAGLHYLNPHPDLNPHQAGWLVVSIPQATDWTLGLGGRSCQAPNQAYRCHDKDYFSELPLELQPQRAGSEVIISNLLRVRVGVRVEVTLSGLPHAYDETPTPTLTLTLTLTR
eukprot:scaffold40115_cov27-Phaeocystis_antarctica.AAC.1